MEAEIGFLSIIRYLEVLKFGPNLAKGSRSTIEVELDLKPALQDLEHDESSHSKQKVFCSKWKGFVRNNYYHLSLKSQKGKA